MADIKNLVSTDWLADHLKDPELVVLHTSYYLGAPGWSPEASYAKGHIPGARLFDIDKVSAQDCPLPHMLPANEAFEKAVSALGVSDTSHVVIYDDGGVRPSFRVWWTFKTFGHDKVSVLDGGLMKWQAEGKPLTDKEPQPSPGAFKAVFDDTKVADRIMLMKNLENFDYQVLDARGPGRFRGEEAEPRPGMKSGHIPGSKNLYFRELFKEDNTLKDEPALKALVEESGVARGRPVITSCGSGVTASILYFVLHRLDFDRLKVYDGSWADWGTAPETPVEKGGP